jgi:citrate synthase
VTESDAVSVKPVTVTVLESAITSIDAEGLRYRGYAVTDLARNATFEDVAWLLWTGEPPEPSDRVQMSADVAAGANLPAQVLDFLRRLPANASPVARLQASLPLLALSVAAFSEASDLSGPRRAARLLGAFATLAGLSNGADAQESDTGNSRRGEESPRVTIAERFLRGVRGSDVSPDEIAGLDRVLILYADHELNASTFAGRVTASTLADMITCVLAALSALRGPLHGGVDRYVRSMLAAGEQEGVESVIDRYVRARSPLPGFGHSVYRGIDPRAVEMRELARRLSPAAGCEKLLALTEAFEAGARRRGLPDANVDLYSVVVYRSLRIPDALSTLVFATARVSGWCAHILEQYEHNRLIRPRAAYMGHGPRPWAGAR